MGVDAMSPNMEAEILDLSAADDQIPEEDADLSNVSNHATVVYAPPDRIAARFYRSSGNRRKSSAASSRRNSLSSTQSHQSSRSYRGGCQSNHVAQHLRRASILETRKARLADRAAHAEQVRLRAALAKATPKSSNCEERALAAQQARERHLAQVAAACAEEVKRAKKVAEDMKERKAAEERKFRLEVAEKHAEAERRRLEYKRNIRKPRTASVPAIERRKSSPDAPLQPSPDNAARCIQRVWRARVRQHAVEKFLDLGLSVDSIHDTLFEDIGALLGEDRVIQGTARLMHVLGLHGHAGSHLEDTTAVRTFLSAYLVLGHPTSVLSKDGAQEQDLIQKAKELLICFESTISKLTARNRFQPTGIQTESLLLVHRAFVNAFSDWKARDSSALVETMVATFVNLDAIWQSVKDDSRGGVAHDYREGIRENQVILLSKIRKLAGPDRASVLIKKAIRESRRTKARRKAPGDIRPRLVTGNEHAVEPSSSKSDSALDDQPISRDAAQQAADSALQNLADSSSSIAENATRGSSSNFAMDQSTTDILSRIFTVLPDNRVLTHEIAIDKDYRIDVSPHSETRDSFNKQICDSMQRGFEQGDGDKWTVAMAKFIRVKLLKLLKEGNSMHNLISETLDPTHIEQQCRQGQFSYSRFFAFMASILPKLCAPFRDEQVKSVVEELSEDGDLPSLIDRLFKLLHIIDLLNLDYSNFMLMQATPYLLKNAEAYEQHLFAQDLENKIITLQKTKRWWSHACVNELTEADRRDPGQRPTSQKIYARGLVDLAVSTAPLTMDEIPETLHLDRSRIAELRAKSIRITLIGSILLTAKNLLKRDVRSSWRAESSRIWEILRDNYSLKDSSMPSKILSAVESSHTMPVPTRNQLSSTIARLLLQANKGRLTDPVAKVLFQRLKGHIFNRVSATSSGERVRAASTATEGLASTGLPEFVVQVGEIVDLIGRISEVDRKAHGKWYELAAAEVEMAGEQDQAA